MLAFRYLLIFAALLGLAAPVTAMPTAAVSSAEAASTMPDDCMEMMADREDPKKSPCDGSFKCMLAMGCLSLNLVAEVSGVTAGETSVTAPEYWPAVTALHGTNSPPDTDPPTTFG